MLRQTLRSFESLMTMTHLCWAAGETVLRDHLSERDSPNHQSIIRLREGSQFEIKEEKGRAFQNRELSCNPVLNLTIAHTATTKNIKRFVWLVTQCPHINLCERLTKSNSFFIFATTKKPMKRFFSCAYRCK